MPYCPNCGSKVIGNADFCSCGYDLKTDDVEQVKPKASSITNKCAKHPAYPVIGTCAGCGSVVCDICRGEVAEKLCLQSMPLGDKLYCPSCTHKVGGIKRIFRRFIQIAKNDPGEVVIEHQYVKLGPNWQAWIAIALYIGGGIALACWLSSK